MQNSLALVFLQAELQPVCQLLQAENAASMCSLQDPEGLLVQSSCHLRQR